MFYGRMTQEYYCEWEATRTNVFDMTTWVISDQSLFLMVMPKIYDLVAWNFIFCFTKFWESCFKEALHQKLYNHRCKDPFCD